jgi:hypothetical protein
LLTTLWERTSARGTAYLSGFLGRARIIGFRGEPTADGTLTWNVYLQPGRWQEEPRPRAAAATQRQPRKVGPRCQPKVQRPPRPERSSVRRMR